VASSGGHERRKGLVERGTMQRSHNRRGDGSRYEEGVSSDGCDSGDDSISRASADARALRQPFADDLATATSRRRARGDRPADGGRSTG